MLGTILEAKETTTSYTNREVIQIKFEVNNEISYEFIPLLAINTIENFARYIKVPIIQKKNGFSIFDLNKCLNKTIPCIKKTYNNREFWCIDHDQMKQIVIERWNANNQTR